MFHKNNNDYWIPLADLMTGMMLVFVLITVVMISKIARETRVKIETNANQIFDIKKVIYQDLYNEFKQDLDKWNATFSESELSIKFVGPNILFATGKKDLKPDFQVILKDFFPRYLNILSKHKYWGAIKEIRIEGHTSSFWGANTNLDDAYFLNMELSEARSRETLRYLYFLNEKDLLRYNLNIKQYRELIRQYIMVSGLSYSHTITDNKGEEIANLSQRVEFKILINNDLIKVNQSGKK